MPVPELLFEDPGDPPDVPPFFVMSFVDGISCEPLFDDVNGGASSRLSRSASITPRRHSRRSCFSSRTPWGWALESVTGLGYES